MAVQVICLGECLIDRLYERPNQAEQTLSTWQDYPGGAPANVATALAKLGTPSAFVGCLGLDEPGRLLFQALCQADVNCEAIQWHPTAPTRIVLVMRDSEGERRFVGFQSADPAGFADAFLNPQYLREGVFAQSTCLVMGTLGLAYGGTGAGMQQALGWAKRYGILTIVDVNWRPRFWPDCAIAPQRIRQFLAQVDILKLSTEEGRGLFQTEDPATILKTLPNLQAVLMTAGVQGCHYATPSTQGSLPAFDVDSEDTTGAGDAFLAGFVHQLCQQHLNRLKDCLKDPNALRQMVRYASAVGALTTMKPGAMAAQPSASEVKAFLYLHP